MTERPTERPYKFTINGVADPENYAAGYPYVTAYGTSEEEARVKAIEYLDPGESVGELIKETRQ